MRKMGFMDLDIWTSMSNIYVLTWRGNNTARPPRIHSKSSHDASIYSIFTSWWSASAIYWPLNRVSMDTLGCLTNPRSWTMAEVISASHKAGKHLCVQKQRKNEDSLLGNWERDWSKNGDCIEEGTEGPEMGQRTMKQYSALLPPKTLTSTSWLPFMCSEALSHKQPHNRKNPEFNLLKRPLPYIWTFGK